MPINVKDSPYRACGNGMADDTEAIQKAINAAVSSGGGSVHLPAGRYSISHPLRWDGPEIRLEGDGGAVIHPSVWFEGEAAVLVGRKTAINNPTLYAGIRSLIVDLSDCQLPDLIAVQLAQCWFAQINGLKIFSPNGLPVARQTAFQLHGGALPGNPPETNWSANNDIYSLQVSGSFACAIRHVGGGPGGTVNATNYFGGACYGNTAEGHKAGTTGFRIEQLAGDTTRVYGMGVSDFDLGAYVGSQNNGPLDFRFENCSTDYETAPGITFSVPLFGDWKP